MGVIFKNNVIYGAGDIEISPVCYSEEEREVGCWIDGKPLYQKTWTGLTITPQYNVWTNLFQVTNIDKIIDWGARDTGTCCLNGTGLELTYDSSSSNYIKAEYTQNSNVRQIGTLTLQYTKTTDTPGSGIWTPSSVPAVHYSTEEQVVGTWVDGQTIYQKTFQFTNLSSATSSWVNLISFPGVDNMLSMTGHTIFLNDGQRQQIPVNNLYVQTTYLNNYLKYYCQSVSGNLDMFLTIQYTKTTS